MTLASKLWIVWLLLSITGGVFLLTSMVYGGYRKHLLIGETTSGHHQIEMACETCHTTPFGGAEALQAACLNCHGEELKLANDSHPIKKFRDPRNADRLEKLNATLCVTCHREHNPKITGAMGVTLPIDYCFKCHSNIGEERPLTHQNLDFASCASAGCHNFHDNRALYEDFLEKHRDQPKHKDKQVVALADWVNDATGPAPEPLVREAADAPAEKATDTAILADWHADAHAKAGVNCSGCHAPKTAGGEAGPWTDRPGHAACATCHANEAKTFVAGKHGMRLREGLKKSHEGLWGLIKDEPLAPMSPRFARAAMKPDAHALELGCATCHGAHRFDTVKAQVEACTSCHADEHTLAYADSPHEKLWRAEAAGETPKGSGVSCATCHMPRTKTVNEYGEAFVFVTHNQNDNLRPNEKMIRSVCADCHGLQFTLDALADPAVIASNFSLRPSKHVESIEWVERRMRKRGALQ